MLSTKLYNSDCMDIFPLLEDESIDCCVSDVPYRIMAGGTRVVYEDDECGGILNKRDYSKTDPKGVLGRGRRIISDGTKCSNKWVKANDKDIISAVKDGKMFDHNDIEFSEWLPELYRVMKKGTHTYLMINGRNLKELQTEAEKVGFVFQNLLCWDKGNFTPNKYYMQGVEFILLLSKRPARNINNMGSVNLISIKNVKDKVHPTEKPVNLMWYLLDNSVSIGDTVLDPFMGSGTTGVASKYVGANFIGIEIDKYYYEIAKDRISNWYPI